MQGRYLPDRALDVLDDAATLAATEVDSVAPPRSDVCFLFPRFLWRLLSSSSVCLVVYAVPCLRCLIHDVLSTRLLPLAMLFAAAILATITSKCCSSPTARVVQASGVRNLTAPLSQEWNQEGPRKDNRAE